MAISGRTTYTPKKIVFISVLFLLLLPSFTTLIAIGSDDGEQPLGQKQENSNPPTRGWLDIAVDNIEIKRPSASNNLYPGQRVRIDVWLIHDSRPQVSDTSISLANGNQFSTVLVIDDGHTNVSTYYKDIKSMRTNYTGDDQPGQGAMNPPYITSFYWTVPDSPPSGESWGDFQYNMYASVTVNDDDKSDNYKSGSGVRISEPFFSPDVKEAEELIDGTGPIHKVKVGLPYAIPFLLRNLGPAIDVIGVAIISYPEGWGVDALAPEVIYPNEEKEFLFPVQVSKNPYLAVSDEIYEVVVRAYSNFYPEGPYEKDSQHTFRFQVEYKPGAEIVPSVSQTYVDPGTTKEVFFDLKNTGNGKTSFTNSVDLDEVHERNGWTVRFGRQTQQLSNVEPGEEAIVILLVTCPKEASFLYNVNLVVRTSVSVGGTAYETESSTCLVYADVRYAGDIQSFREPIKADPGKENIIKFNFTNEGNTQDEDQKLRVDYKPRGWGVHIEQSQMLARPLGPRTRTMLEMRVFVPETATTTKWESPPYVTIQAVHQFDGDNILVLDEEKLYFEIPLRHKLELSSPEPAKVGFLGGQVEYTIDVINKGNYWDSFNLSVDSEWCELERSWVQAIPNETYPIRLFVDIPFDAAADTNPDTPVPDYRGYYDGYRIRVYGYSTNETTEGKTLTWVDLTVYVQPFYNFEMELDPEQEPLRFSMDHDNNRAIRVKISNLGNIQDRIRLSWVDNPYSWLDLKRPSVDVGFRETQYAIINLDIDKHTITDEGNITVDLVGRSTYQQRDFPGQEPLEVIIPITLYFYRLTFDIHTPRVNNEEIGNVYTADYNRRYSLQVEIENTGLEEFNPTRFGRMFVVLYDDNEFEVDRANITYLKSGEIKEVIFTYTAATPGTHNMKIALEGDVREVPISDMGEKELPFVMKVEREAPGGQDEDEEIAVSDFLIPLILLIIFITAIFVFVSRYNQIYISPIDTGYDESGEYKPWAVKERLRQETEGIAPPEEKPALPEPEKPSLPPAPSSDRSSKGPQPSKAPTSPPVSMPPPGQQSQGSQVPRPRSHTPSQQARQPIPQQRGPQAPPQQARQPIPQQRGPQAPPQQARQPIPQQRGPQVPGPRPQQPRQMQRTGGPVNPPSPSQNRPPTPQG